MSPPKNNLGSPHAQSCAIILSVLFLIPAPSSGVAGSGGGLLQTGSISEDFDIDGNRVFYAAGTNTFDVHGRVETAVFTTVFNRFQPTTNLDTSTFTYDKAGNLVLVTRKSDTGADGTVDHLSITTISNLNQYQTVMAFSTESVPDGTVESIGTETETFDEQRRVIRSEVEIDSDGDGRPDYRYVTTWDYDEENHRIYQVQESDWDGDGVVDETVQTTYVTDDRGNVLSSESGNPLGSFIEVGTFSYNKFGNLLQMVLEAGEPADLVIAETTTVSYSHRGEIIPDSNPASATRALPSPDSLPASPTGVRFFRHRYVD